MKYRYLYKSAAPTTPAGAVQKPAAPQPAPAPTMKLNMRKMPGRGDTPEYKKMWWQARETEERNKALSEYQSAAPDIRSKYKTPEEYATWKMEQNRWRWDPNAARRYIGEGYSAGRKDVEAHTKGDWYTLGFTSNIDEDWMNEFAGKRAPDDPVELARWRNYTNAVQGHADVVEQDTSARANAGMHVAGKTLDGLTLGVGHPGEAYTKAITGQTTEELAREFGDFAGSDAERWLRAAGVTSEMAASMPATMMLGHIANGGMLAHKGLNGARQSFNLVMGDGSNVVGRFPALKTLWRTYVTGAGAGTNPSVGLFSNMRHATPIVGPQAGRFVGPALQRLADFTYKTVGSTANAYRILKPTSNLMTGLGNVADNGGRIETGAPSFWGDTGRITGKVLGDVADTYPVWAAAGYAGAIAKPFGILGKSYMYTDIGTSVPVMADNALNIASRQYAQHDITKQFQEQANAEIEEYARQLNLPLSEAKQRWSRDVYRAWDMEILAKNPDIAKDPAKLAQARFARAKKYASLGAVLPDSIFEMPGMTQEARTDLFKTWAESYGLGYKGKLELVGSGARIGWNALFGKGTYEDAINNTMDAIKQETFKDMLQRDPQFRATADKFMATSVASYVKNPTADAMTPENLQYFKDYCEAVGQVGVDKALTPAFANLSPEQWNTLIEWQDNASALPMVQLTASKYLINEVTTNPAKGGALLPALLTQMKQNKGAYQMAQRLKPELNNLFAHWDQKQFDQFADAGAQAFKDDDQFYTFAKAMVSGNSEVLDGLPDAAKQKLEAGFTKAVQTRVFDSVIRNPGNLNKAVSLWVRSKGMPGLADAMENPWVFYGGLALLVGGVGVISTLSNSDDEDEDDDAAYKKRVRSRYMSPYGTPYTAADIMRSVDYGE